VWTGARSQEILFESKAGGSMPEVFNVGDETTSSKHVQKFTVLFRRKQKKINKPLSALKLTKFGWSLIYLLLTILTFAFISILKRF
jgi:hypothetical protein